MKNKVEPKTLAGFMELNPEDQVAFNKMMNIIVGKTPSRNILGGNEFVWLLYTWFNVNTAWNISQINSPMIIFSASLLVDLLGDFFTAKYNKKSVVKVVSKNSKEI